jgi:NAD(P)-dependent dehydrogenase (short-subunit alcohol dehydrogenase family)
MPISIEGKRIIATGGARGIAADAVGHFAAEGASVVSFDITDEAGMHVAAEATAKGPGTVTYRHVDVSSETEVQDGTAFAVETLGGLDAVFNSAAIDVVMNAEDMTDVLWDRLLGVNIKGIAHVCQAVFPYLKERGGSIVNFGSDVGLMDRPATNIGYGATKGAVIAYTRLLAGAWGKYGIRANVVNPLVKTPLYEELVANLTPEQLAEFTTRMKDAVPLGGDLGNSSTDLAPVLAFLASDASKFISSQIFGVNGGMNPAR